MIKVVAVDSDGLTLELYKQGLTARGYSVQIFTSAAQSREYLSQTPEVPDVIFIDIMMPDVDGLTLIHEFHSASKTSGVPIIAVSTIKDATMLTDVFIFGASDYMVKPFDIDILDIKIKRAVETARKKTNPAG